MPDFRFNCLPAVLWEAGVASPRFALGRGLRAHIDINFLDAVDEADLLIANYGVYIFESFRGVHCRILY